MTASHDITGRGAYSTGLTRLLRLLRCIADQEPDWHELAAALDLPRATVFRYIALANRLGCGVENVESRGNVGGYYTLRSWGIFDEKAARRWLRRNT